ncbi:SHOCT domain-containing protein [Micromonospora haikouensis]|uniref:SHOCT domain-containing protein n=1 Tax=Micromonospora haikouensis TaxID=686309 RepID=UPI0037B5161E
MKAAAREIVSLVVGLTGIVLLGVGLDHVLDIGSCSTGGSYVVARPCPEGSAVWFWVPMAGAIMWILGLVGGGRSFTEPGSGQVLWTVGFAGGGAALLVKVLTQPSMPPDARLGASIVAAVSIPMGLIVGVVGLVQLVRRRRGRGSGPRRSKNGDPRRRDGQPGAGRDPWSRLKALNDLRSTGALTREEFVALRADLADPASDARRAPAIDRVALIRQFADQRASGALSAAEFEVRKRGVMRGERVD